MDDSAIPPQPPESVGAGPQQPESAPTEPSAEPSPEMQQPTQPERQPPTWRQLPRLNLNIRIPRPRLVASAILLVLVLAVILRFTPGILTPTSTTSVSTTVQQVNLTRISSCVAITKPGTYYLTSNINTTATNGPCIAIRANSVWFVGNQHRITGSGPYTGVPPFSYGVEIDGAYNDSVTTLAISRFSYGIFLNNAQNAKVAFNNITASTLSGVYFLNASNITMQQNYIAGSLSKQGGIYLRSGNFNRFINNTIMNNAYYGVVINTTSNNFTQDTFVNNPADLVCNANTAPSYTNLFTKSKCYVNDYCGFASCKTNVPFNLSLIRLAPGQVSTCGVIYTPGNYLLSKSISTTSYINASSPLAKGVSCILVLAPNVNFNCQGKQINNSGYGIYMKGAFNTNVTNCVLSNDNYGLYAGSSFTPQISNTLAINDTYGIYISNTTGGKISNANFVGNNTYGLYINSSSGVLFNNINAHGNVYGVYVNSGGSDVFNGGSVANNTKSDVYCTPATYNSTTNLAQTFSCGVTDCTWASASCRQTVQPVLASIPLKSCQTIRLSGNYSVPQSIIAKSTGNCFSIQANNVALNCKSNVITGLGSGSAFTASNYTNVSISNCRVEQFSVGINASNSKKLSITSFNITATAQGLSFTNVSGSKVSGVKVNGPTSGGFTFRKLNSSTIVNNFARSGASSASGFVFVNSTLNRIQFNNATRNPQYGFEFLNSRNNTINNNSADSNVNFDYACFGSSTGLYSNRFGVNYGLTKNTCKWLVALSPIVSSPSCAGIFTPVQLSFTRDILYTIGGTCYSVFATGAYSANGTSINCNGHTVYAPNGGTFLKVVNASGVKVSNCLFWGFSTVVQTSNEIGTTVSNNTFADVGNAIVLSGSRSASVYKNVINNNTNGIIASSISLANIYNNNLYNNTYGIALIKSNSSGITNNTAYASKVGLYLENTTSTSILNNLLLNSTVSGVQCLGASVNKSSNNLDYGGNICSKNSNCRWVTVSPQCKPS